MVIQYLKYIQMKKEKYTMIEIVIKEIQKKSKYRSLLVAIKRNPTVSKIIYHTCKYDLVIIMLLN